MDFQKFLLIQHLPWFEEVSNLSRLLYLEYYQPLREEILIISPTESFKETQYIIPTYNKYLSLFPDLPVPEWFDEKMDWSVYDYQRNDSSTSFDIMLWESVLPKRRKNIALSHLLEEFKKIRSRVLIKGKIFTAYTEQ